MLSRVEIENLLQAQYAPLAQTQATRLSALVRGLALPLRVILALPLQHLEQHSCALSLLLRCKFIPLYKILVLLDSPLKVLSEVILLGILLLLLVLLVIIFQLFFLASFELSDRVYHHYIISVLYVVL